MLVNSCTNQHPFTFLQSNAFFNIYVVLPLLAYIFAKVRSRSSTEAEYLSLATTTVDLYWLPQLLCDLHVPLITPPTLWCDNASARPQAHNPVFHAKTKHIEIDYHFARKKVLRKDITVRHISSDK